MVAFRCHGKICALVRRNPVPIARRKFLHLAAGAVAMPAIARAETYPARPVRILIGFNAGGAPDVVARLLAQWLSEHVGQNFLIENRPGAAGNIAAEAVVRAPPDGYTLLQVGSPNFINASLYKDLKFDFLRDIAAVASVGRNPFVMEVNPAFPAKTVAEFIAYGKAHPGEINMTSTGTGNLTHVVGEWFKQMAGVDMVHVPARGEMQAQSDLLAGRAQVMFDPIVSSLGYLKAGQLRALGVTGATRLDVIPDVPTVAATVPGFEVTGALGFGAPKDTPADVINFLNAKINAALADPGIKAKLVDLGFVPSATTPAEFEKLIAEETARWADVIATAKIKPE
jgi:tripartite-type tricarboxylate transporter receptor subunit TctC